MLSRIAPASDAGVGIYLDFPPADLSAESVIKEIVELLSSPRTSERASPDFVPSSIAKNGAVNESGGRNGGSPMDTGLSAI